jgi:23S rRNA pseudoU1915 N3-methylase RlmH
VIIQFILPWGLKKGSWKKAFKHSALSEMVGVYQERLSHFVTAEITVCESVAEFLGRPAAKKAAAWHWVLDLPRNRRAKILSSEELARGMQELMNRGVTHLRIFVGPPDGWTESELNLLDAALVWSFGPMTLTHEMAAMLALEQVYRGFTIVRGLPYHSGH